MKIIKYSFLAIIFIIITIYFAIPFYFSASVAQYAGEIEHEFLEEDVEITFDQKGIPQIWAKNDKDMYFTLGWLHASERLFQMELIKRVSYGEISELLGSDALEHDKKQRLIGFARKAKNEVASVDNNSAKMIDAYCKGINAWVESKSVLPFEFAVFGIEPNHWSIENVLAISIYQSWFAHSLMDKDKDYQKLIDILGNKAKELLLKYDDWSPATISESVASIPMINKYAGLNMSLASNSWVVNSDRSESGKSIHASDPHLQVNMAPGFWYTVGLHSNDLDFVGITAVGIPTAAMGHSKKIAYAFTVASIDLIDYYQIPKIENNKVTLFGKEEELVTINETIRIKAKEAFHYTFQTTSLGPIEDTEKNTVLKWAGFDFNYGEEIHHFLNLIRVENWEEFRTAVTGFGALDVNWTYSDHKGNIGYQLGAPIPVRDYEDTYSLLDASDIKFKWNSYLPLDSTPHSYNPAKGYVATSNNQIVEKTKKKIPGFFDNYRIKRLDAELRRLDKANVQDMNKLQMDRYSVKASRWVPLLIEGLENINETELAKDFKTWDFIQTKDDVRPTIFTMWWEKLPEYVFDELGDNVALGKHLLERSLSDNDIKWYDNKNTEYIETRIDVISACLEDVLVIYRNMPYGEFSNLLINHPIGGASALLDFWLSLNRGPFPFESDNSTLNANFPVLNKEDGKYYTVAAASMRYVLDWSDINAFTIQGNLGQSGNPFSTHYDDFLRDWLEGKRWTVPIDREEVDKKIQSILKLKARKRGQ